VFGIYLYGKYSKVVVKEGSDTLSSDPENLQELKK
jgi:hypothetical protein